MNKDQKNSKCSTEEWVRCKSKNRPGWFYMFNTTTGETKWCGKSGECPKDCSEEADKRDSPPKLQRLKTPAQDRLKRLRNNLQNEKKSKSSQKQRTTSQNITNKANMNNNVASGIKFAETTQQTEEDEADNKTPVGVKRVAVKEEMPACSVAVKDEVQINEVILTPNKKIKLETATPNSQKENPHKFSAVRNGSRSLRGKAPKKNPSAQHINPLDKIKEVPIEATTSRKSSEFDDENAATKSEVSNTRGLGADIIDKIKSIYKSTFNTSPKKSRGAIKSVTKPIFKPPEKCTSNKKLSVSHDSSSPKMKNSAPLVVLSPKSTQMTTPPSLHNTPKNLIIPCYERGSANSRLDRLRKSIMLQPTISDCLKDTISISNVSTTTSTSDVGCSKPNNSISINQDIEPMDWQSIDDEPKEMPVEISNSNSNNYNDKFTYKNRNLASSPNKCGKTEDKTVNEYYDAVNENLLRFSIQQQKSIRNATQEWLRDHYYFVIDTNVLLNHITFVEDLTEMKLCGTKGTIIFIPYIVLQELDKLKIRSSNESAKTLTVRAIRYLNAKFEERNKHMRAQSARDERQHLIDITCPDDSILNCCLQVKQQVENVVLLTEDVNLRNKAICNNILVSTKSDLISKHASSTPAVESRKCK